MFTLKIVTKAKKDLTRLKKTSINDFNIVYYFITDLLKTGFKGVKPQYKPHKLTGNYKDY
jgi:mRNA-degrading endonuclease YafQ of YafQ-DinJ toxin-antitoxin module